MQAGSEILPERCEFVGGKRSTGRCREANLLEDGCELAIGGQFAAAMTVREVLRKHGGGCDGQILQFVQKRLRVHGVVPGAQMRHQISC